jgi:hypothetical protein
MVLLRVVAALENGAEELSKLTQSVTRVMDMML